MEIKKNYNILKACRFCPMCKHLCPSGNLTFHESDYPRGRGLVLYSVYRGEKYNSEYANALYNCFMCGSCLAGCEGNFDLPELIRSSRVDMASAGLEPGYIRTIKDIIMETGNIYASKTEDSFVYSHKKFINDNAQYIYIPGSGANFQRKEIAEAAVKVFKKLDIDFGLFAGDYPHCGKVLSVLGYEKEAEDAAVKTFEMLKNYRSRNIVTSDPLIYDFFKNDANRWGNNLKKYKVMYFSELAEKIIRDKNIELKKYEKRVAVADSEYLCKKNKSCSSYRYIIIQSAGKNFIEFSRNRELAPATGEAAFYCNYGPFKQGKELVEKVLHEAKAMKLQTIITLSVPAKQNFTADKPDGIQIIDIAEFMASVLD
jgi:Fe-S oxidoreductase